MEIEIKIHLLNLQEFREKIELYNFKLLEPKFHEYNIVFDTPDKQLQVHGHLLRLRKQGEKSIITFKSPPENPSLIYKIRKEIETFVSSFDNMHRIFVQIGLVPVFVYEKYREIYENQKVKLMIDETPIGNYAEIEGSELDIDTTAAILGYGRGDYITESYRSLFLKRGITESRNMLFKSDNKT